jgi:hypothetical protein
MEEKVFYDDGKLKVTNVRFIVDDETFVLSGITSIKKVETNQQSNSGGFSVLIIFLGIAAIFAGTDWSKYLVAVVLFLIAFAFKPKITKIYNIATVSAGTEAKLFSTTDKELADKIIVALNDAIIYSVQQKNIN